MAMLITFLYKCFDNFVCFTILRRESIYCIQKNDCVPLFLFSYDASEETENGSKLGRLVNPGYNKEINAKMKIVIVKGEPILCLFANKDIVPGSEILYDYGQKHYPWEKKVRGTKLI
jgi:hypothetical protein